jgi:hypothetical protein
MCASSNEITAAAKKAIELFDNSVYKDKSASVGLFLAEVVSREKELTSLLSPRLGDSLIQANGVPWLDALGKSHSKLQPLDIHQIAALPLGSHLRTDAWDDKEIGLNAPTPLITNAGDKLPLEVTPVYQRLQYYQPPVPDAAVPPAGAAPAAPGDGGQAAATGGAATPAPPAAPANAPNAPQ